MSESLSSPNLPKKRSRVQLSCTACRNRKLKCCRTYPCTNCRRRGEADSCTYVGRGPRGRTTQERSNPSLLQDRLQHLENLVMSFSRGKGDDGPFDNTEMSALQEDMADDEGNEFPTPESNNTIAKPPADPSGKLVVKDAGTSYIDGSHWKAILEEINDMKAFLQQSDGGFEDVADDFPFDTSSTSPALLAGLNRPASIHDLLSDIPSRPVADRLVSRCLNSAEPSLMVLHVPTFQVEYDQFWVIPDKVSLPWLGLLYAVMTMAVSIYRRSEDPLPYTPDSPVDFMDIYRKRAAQCLAQCDYTVPGKYKVEALFLYGMGEFLRSNDAQAGVSFILGITTRLAMQMGYHRDARHYPDISAFDGEMRRRLWATLCQLDTLISFQVGLPKTIQGWHYDTDLPHNLPDQDFDPSMENLPPPRPDTELTPSSYTRSKSRLMSVFGRITDLAYSRNPTTYEETLDLDRRLEEAHSLLPPVLQIKPMDRSISDPPVVIMRRYTLEFLYQKARCVLHRRYLAEARSNLRYAYSQSVCISAAKEILRHQMDIYNESQPGGQLYRERLFLNSIQNTDYLLAAMIICLELSYTQHSSGSQTPAGSGVAVVVNGREDLLATLETSHRILGESRRRSADSQKAYAGLTAMLQRLKGGVQEMYQFEQNAFQFGGLFPDGDAVDPSLFNLGFTFP